MKKFLLILITSLAFLATDLSAQTGTAQKAKPDSVQTTAGAERVQALKVAFITKRLDLTSEEAEKFWPIYNEYSDKRDAVRKQLQADYKMTRDQADQLTPDQLSKLVDDEMALKQQDVALQMEMNDKLKKVLPPKKLAQLYVAEEDFKKELLRILTEDNKQGTGNK